MFARSNIGFGAFRDGLYPLRGGVTPELRGVMNGIFDTYLSGILNPTHTTGAAGPAHPAGVPLRLRASRARSSVGRRAG
jgi:hypothetical protein